MKAAWVLLLLVALAVPGFAQAPDDNLVVPGQRIGKWTLQMTIADLVRMNGPQNGSGITGMGKPIMRVRETGAVDSLEDVWAHNWDKHFFFAGTLGETSQQVVFLATFAEESRTARDISLGASRQGVEAVYGKPTATTRLRVIYDDIGLAVRIMGDRATVLMVFRPGSAKQIWMY
jgi:hypothetical protein